jgi:hypothetical protein
MLGQERNRHERALAEIRQTTTGRVRVLAGTNDLLKSLSPFPAYGLGSGPVLMLTGWPSYHPSQARLRRRLTGAADQTTALRRLAQAGPGTQWVLTPETAQWLNRRFRYAPGTGPIIVLQPVRALAADTSLWLYQPVAH